MKVEHWDGDCLCGDTGFKDQDYTPEGVLADYPDRRVMWGNCTYYISNVQYFDPDNIKLGIIVHLE